MEDGEKDAFFVKIFSIFCRKARPVRAFLVQGRPPAAQGVYKILLSLLQYTTKFYSSGTSFATAGASELSMRQTSGVLKCNKIRVLRRTKENRFRDKPGMTANGVFGTMPYSLSSAGASICSGSIPIFSPVIFKTSLSIFPNSL